MSGCLLSPKPKTCCAICSCFQDATLFDLIRLMLRCCATLATSYCWVIFFSDLCFLVIWSCLHDVKRLSLLSFSIFSASCYVLALPCLIWGLVFKMLCCLIFSTSCYAASPATPTSCCLVFTLYQIFAFWSFDLAFMMLSGLIFSASR